jgi:1,4-dihydroxy-2-naphthoate octaprenyltransferase
VGAALAFFYHAPPFKLAYHGLGELAVAIAYGPVIAAGTYLVQHGTIDRAVLYASLPLGAAIMAFLWINELPDRRADELAGKRTLVVRLGRRAAARGFAAVVTGAFAMVAALPALGLPWTTLLGFIGLPLGVLATRRVARYGHDESDSIEDLIPAQGWTLLTFLLMAIGLGAGMLLSL